ncbi:hypothetical protein GR140_30660 (plasmid) [Pseudomonas putida]|uniref:hypothetical protein n=1 Tax=Pseudomonas putida TaxID=303 RepID=UPI001BB0C949|nr:hypothetical protein [Pseudomonas putida]QUG93128.1 hypothetical protein GR140_30660 [Pseudomonas putida]
MSEKMAVATSSLSRSICKGFGTVALAVVAACFAAYARHAFGGWIFALSFLLVIACSVPMVKHFDLMPTSKAHKPKRKDLFEEDDPGPFYDPITGFHRNDDD